MRLPIDQIEVGTRTRQDAGDIDSLAASMDARGLIQPVVIRPDGDGWLLVAGYRRIVAARRLGWAEIQVVVAETIADELTALYAEGEENTCRADFTVEEAVAHRKRIRDVESALARQRQRDAGRMHGRGQIASGKLPEAVEPRHERETRQRTARATGYSGRTLDKAEQVLDAAADPARSAAERAVAKEAAAEICSTGRVDGAYKKLKAASRPHTDQNPTGATTGDVAGPRPEPGRRASRRPLPDFAADAAVELEKAVQRVERVLADDRLPRNLEQVAHRLWRPLQYAARSCPDLLHQLPEPEPATPMRPASTARPEETEPEETHRSTRTKEST